MEKVTLYIKRILALFFSFSVMPLLVWGMEWNTTLLLLPGLPVSFLLFSVLNYKITGDKPMYLFGVTQSDAHLTKKGGFWNLFKWIVNVLGFLYDLLLWIFWGAFLVFMLIVDLILLIKLVAYWIVYAIIWFIRQLFPPFIFLFKMFVHYIINWSWWIYQVAFRNVRISINKNFYIIALYGTIPALFIVFLFYATSLLVGVPELVILSAIFAIVPLVWSYGEISALRYEEREKDDYTSVKYKFRNGWDAVRSILFYLIAALILVFAEQVLNLLGWIPNLSMSFLGIALNLNMAISLVLIFLAVILIFADLILPTHILYHHEHENDLRSSLGFLKVICQKFLRYIVAMLPTTFFGGVLLIIPAILLILTLNITDKVKDSVMDTKINYLEKLDSLDAVEEYQASITIKRLNLYKEILVKTEDPEDMELADEVISGDKGPLDNYFMGLRESGQRIADVEQALVNGNMLMRARRARYEEERSQFDVQIEVAMADSTKKLLAATLVDDRTEHEASYLELEEELEDQIAIQELVLKEEKSVRIQLPILYLLAGILFSIFGGLVVAVFIAYLGNVAFELYNMREDEDATYWTKTILALKEKDGNQPLLGFTFLAIIALLLWLFGAGGLGVF